LEELESRLKNVAAPKSATLFSMVLLVQQTPVWKKKVSLQLASSYSPDLCTPSLGQKQFVGAHFDLADPAPPKSLA
jgi:hypothetical protein